ncbi:MAG TPA: methyltransferase, partial [Saprospiraceae bacterium]|nr:methyltransferase [Saprospiraceae bacterium]
MGSKDIFRFQQFEVKHDKVGLKVGTDGVLLGAWADVAGAQDILDIGTGSGLIALMLAQRHPSANIHAIDIMIAASEQAIENFNVSPWAENLRCFHISA